MANYHNTIQNILRKKIAEPLYGLYCRSPKLDYWKILEETQYWPENKLRQIQWRRLKKMVQFVWGNNDFYAQRFKQAGFSPADFKKPEDITKLPILTKADVRYNAPRMISSGFKRQGLHAAKTGGSTGKALELFFTEECSELRNACARRHDRWTGWEPGEPIAACWGNPHLPSSLKEKLKHLALLPMIYLDTMQVNEASVHHFVDEWQRAQPTLLYGHAHSIFILAQFLRKLKIKEPKPKGILSTSMMLMPSEREIIEAQFGTKVIDRYGCEEVSLIGCECEQHEGLHLNIEHLFIEFIKDDGSSAGPGEPGSIVVTDLLNMAMPLIRYKVEDVGISSDKKCSCGRGLPLMEGVVGRVADFLVKEDGTKVAGISLIENTLTRFKGLDQMQIVQQEIDQFLIRIVPGNEFRNSTSLLLKEYFRMIFGSNICVEIALIDKILPEKSGKYRFSICSINSN
jgi:phenylacetate-CoA ligase